jgi:hypothetical protein
MEINTNAKRDEVEKLISEWMVGDKAEKMRQKAIELKKKAEAGAVLCTCEGVQVHLLHF